MIKTCVLILVVLSLTNRTTSFYRPSPFYYQPNSRFELPKPALFDQIKDLYRSKETSNDDIRTIICSAAKPGSSMWSDNRCWEHDVEYSGYKGFMRLRFGL